MAGGGGGGEGGDDLDIGINLTALLDVLTNLLFFLLFGFAAQRATVEVEAGVELPVSSAINSPELTVRLTISETSIRLEKDEIVAVEGGKVPGERVDGRIDPLYRRLQALKNEARPELQKDPDVLFVICDKDTSYGLLREVLMTAAEAGFPKYRLAVITE